MKTWKLLPDEVITRHYGCGCPLPEDDLTGEDELTGEVTSEEASAEVAAE